MVKANHNQEREACEKGHQNQPPAQNVKEEHQHQPEDHAQQENAKTTTSPPPTRPAQDTPSLSIDKISTPNDLHQKKITSTDDDNDDDVSISSESAVHKNYRTFVTEPNENDIIGGRGAAIQSHPGNTYYRYLIRTKKREYINSRPPMKKKIIRAVVKAIESQSPPGRFLKEDLSYHSAGTRYICVTLDEAKKKVGQALREDAPRFKKKTNHFRFSNHRGAQQKGGIQDPAPPTTRRRAGASTSGMNISASNLRLTQEEAELVIDIRRSNLLRKNTADSNPDVMVTTAEMPPLQASSTLLDRRQRQGEGQTHDISTRATNTINGAMFLGTTPAEEVLKPNCKILRNSVKEGMMISNAGAIPSHQFPQYIPTTNNVVVAPTERMWYDPLTTAMLLGGRQEQADIYTPSISWEGRDTAVLVQQHYQEPPALLQYHGARHIPSDTSLAPIVIIGGEMGVNTATSSMAQTKSTVMGITNEGAPPTPVLSPAFIDVVPSPEGGAFAYQTPFIVSQPAAQYPQQQMDDYEHLLLSMSSPSPAYHQPQHTLMQHRNYQHDGRVTAAAAADGVASSDVGKNPSS